MQYPLINGHSRNIRYNEFARGSVCEVHVKVSDEQIGLKEMKSSYWGR